MIHAGLEGGPGAATVRIEASGLSDVGSVRLENQDALVVAGWVGLGPTVALTWRSSVSGSAVVPFAVVDGMGGHAGGAYAAALVAMGLAEVVAAGEPGRVDALEALSDRVFAAGGAWGTPEMGATAALLLVTGGGVRVLNLGDCRVVRLAGGYVGELTVEDRAVDPRVAGGTVVTQSLGGRARALDPHEAALPHQAGAVRYLLSSDGLHDVVSEDRLAELLGRGTAAEVASALVSAALEQGAPDNVSVLVVDVTAPEGVGV